MQSLALTRWYGRMVTTRSMQSIKSSKRTRRLRIGEVAVGEVARISDFSSAPTHIEHKAASPQKHIPFALMSFLTNIFIFISLSIVDLQYACAFP